MSDKDVAYRMILDAAELLSSAARRVTITVQFSNGPGYEVQRGGPNDHRPMDYWMSWQDPRRREPPKLPRKREPAR
jgi:hypothetical protein